MERKQNRGSGTPSRSRLHLSLQEQPYTQLICCKKTKRLHQQPSPHLAKDLRVRRVYSPPQSTASDLIQSVHSDCSPRKVADLGLGSSLSVENGDARTESPESPDLRLSCEARSSVRGNSESPDERSRLLDHKRCDGTNNGDCSGKIDDLDGEHLITTPPDAETCGGSKVNEDEVKREDEVRVKDAGAAKSKSVLRPRFQGKLFKAPGSVNYRRLFPFLMDAMRDDSGAPKLGFCQKDEGMDGREFVLPLTSQSHEASKQERKIDNCSMRGTNGSKLTSSHCLHESPMLLDSKCLPVLPVDDKCLSESKVHATAEFNGVNDVGSALHNDEFKQYSSPTNNLDYAKASNQKGCRPQQSGALNEECILTTPDAERYDNSGVNVEQLESTPQDVDSIKPMDLTRSSQENSIEGFCPKSDTGKYSLKRKSVLRQHLHRKLFKAPGSVSYKRLLPFLADLTKDDAGTSKFGHQDSGTLQQTESHDCDLYNDRSSPKSQIPEFQSSHDSCKVIQQQDEPVVLNALFKPEGSTDSSITVNGINIPNIPLAPVITVTLKEKTTSALSKSSVFDEVKENTSFLVSSNEKPHETHECCQSLSQPKVLEQFRVPADGLKRGILKRNPRGCRGLCTCLNCASFRLHSERAFEFSRNQLLDAEEVAHDLMKELSHLRNMLERSTDTIKNSPVFYGSQVIEACRKALAAEQLAKDRLSQMNDDLNIHCRTTSLQRPRVTFADHVGEKVIQPGG